MNTEMYNLSTSGRDNGHGTFGHGTVTKIDGGYHLDGGSQRGINFGCYLDVVFVDYLTEPNLELHETMDVSGKEFRLGDGELHLRD
jgi:hypothetical protein